MEIRIADKPGRIEWAVLVNGEAVVGGYARTWTDAFRVANEARQVEATCKIADALYSEAIGRRVTIPED